MSSSLEDLKLDQESSIRYGMKMLAAGQLASDVFNIYVLITTHYYPSTISPPRHYCLSTPHPTTLPLSTTAQSLTHYNPYCLPPLPHHCPATIPPLPATIPPLPATILPLPHHCPATILPLPDPPPNFSCFHKKTVYLLAGIF